MKIIHKIKIIGLKFISSFNKKYLPAWYTLAFCLIITFIFTYIVRLYVLKDSEKKFMETCLELRNKIDSRLDSYSTVLYSGVAFFGASDSVTRQEWGKFISKEKLDRNLPGVQGVGYSTIVDKRDLQKHIRQIRNEGFPNYVITPTDSRDIYTSIIYLEPFTGRNLRAFGFDMFSEKIRKSAMEQARDYDIAALSGKVELVQETGADVQAGCLMYVPVYNNNSPINSIENRRKSIKGWVFCPFRMNDLMIGILNPQIFKDPGKLKLEIFDGNSNGNNNLLFSSYRDQQGSSGYNLIQNQTIDFNGKKWLLTFYHNDDAMTMYLLSGIVISLFSGIIISLLLFIVVLELLDHIYLNKKLTVLNEELDESSKKRALLNDELAESELELKKTIATKDKLFSILAHDLRSPFSGFIGLTELLMTGSGEFTERELREIGKELNQSANSIFSLLNDLLMWSRSQIGALSYYPENVDLFQVINNTSAVLVENAKAKNITIINNLTSGLIVVCDINMIKTIVRNLISNSIKFTPNGGKISIDYAIENNYIRIFIADTGIGMDIQTVAKLFKLGENVSRKGTNFEEGTGLGLALCKEFIEKNGGEIFVESIKDSGSIFSFTLPKSKN